VARPGLVGGLRLHGSFTAPPQARPHPGHQQPPVRGRAGPARRDGGVHPPPRRSRTWPGRDDENDRGVMIVAALSADWGHYQPASRSRARPPGR
jgi:hypothetical protein